jgi:uncharacterized membrane protein (UPF0127 family)
MLTGGTSKTIIAHHIEWMKTPQSRARGLLKYSQSPTSHAAIFELPLNGFLPLVHTFGMKFPIDILFLDREQRVRWMKRSVPSSRFVFPWARALGGLPYLVEVCKGDTAHLQVGDQLQWGEA